jgi:hypothetical protein
MVILLAEFAFYDKPIKLSNKQMEQVAEITAKKLNMPSPKSAGITPEQFINTVADLDFTNQKMKELAAPKINYGKALLGLGTLGVVGTGAYYLGNRKKRKKRFR